MAAHILLTTSGDRHGWMSQAESAHFSGVTEHGVSARQSDLKKLGVLSEKRKAGSLYEYRLVRPDREG